jgi:hypothetical protein
MALPAIVDEEAIFILRRPWLVAPQATIFTAGTFPCDGEFLPLHAGPILARGIITAAPAHALAGSATIAHTAAESDSTAHTCAAAITAAHSLTPRAAPAHTFSLEVVI